MDDTEYIMIGIWLIILVIIIGKDLWETHRDKIKCREYINLGLSRGKKIMSIFWGGMGILWADSIRGNLRSGKNISSGVVWVGLSIIWIYRYTKLDLVFEGGIGEKDIFGRVICKIKWEQIEGYKRTYQDEIVIDYRDKNNKNKKYSIYLNNEKINLLYNELEKHIKNK